MSRSSPVTEPQSPTIEPHSLAFEPQSLAIEPRSRAKAARGGQDEGGPRQTGRLSSAPPPAGVLEGSGDAPLERIRPCSRGAATLPSNGSIPWIEHDRIHDRDHAALGLRERQVPEPSDDAAHDAR